MSDTVVPLSKPYEAHGKTFDSVTLREPLYPDVMALGEPQQWQPTGQQGQVVLITLPEIVSAYLDRCCKAPGPECLPVLGARDTLKVQGALLNFFLDPPTPKEPQTTSSSTSDGDQPTSET